MHEGPRSHAMGVDATPFVEPLLTSRALSFLSYHPEIPYSKGASLWHMLEAFWDSAGQDAFRVGSVLTPLHLFGALFRLFGYPFRVLERLLSRFLAVATDALIVLFQSFLRSPQGP